MRSPQGFVAAGRVTMLAAVVVATSAAAQPTPLIHFTGSPAKGSGLAARSCAVCHLVAPGQLVDAGGIPTFASIATRLPADQDVLIGIIADPHPPMPNLMLSRQDIADVLAYIASLK